VIYPPTYYSFASGGAKAGGAGLVGRVKEGLDSRNYRRAQKLLGTGSPRILDVGGSTGEISSRFVRDGGRATVVDLDSDSIEIARGRGLDGFVGRIEDFETDDRFDLALMLNLIEHVPDPVGVMAHVRSLMRPEGLIWLQTPNFRALDGRVFRHRNWAGYHCPRHFAIFSEVGLRRALARAGLEPVRFERTQGGGFWSQSLLGLPRARRMAAASPGPTLEQGGVPVERLPKPLVRFRAFPPLAAAGTAFDMATRPLREVSQVMVLAKPA
jgi:SAM-dependent methyltransferase